MHGGVNMLKGGLRRRGGKSGEGEENGFENREAERI